MCLTAFAFGLDRRWPLVLAANRDEFFDRPATAMGWWPDCPDVLAGRDAQAGGTWFGLSRAGRLALLTNVREPARHDPAALSRGALATDWLLGQDDAAAFAGRINSGHNGFNLITADLPRGDWHWLSNRHPGPQRLATGLHGVSNAGLGTPWPKLSGLRADMAAAMAQARDDDELADRLFTALADTTLPPDAALPDTGVGLARERALAPRFVRITGPDGAAVYGTRCATVLIQRADGATRVIERSVDAHGTWLPPAEHRLAPWP
jgi:uncharacterized protein with NRDE domain